MHQGAQSPQIRGYRRGTSVWANCIETMEVYGGFNLVILNAIDRVLVPGSCSAINTFSILTSRKVRGLVRGPRKSSSSQHFNLIVPGAMSSSIRDSVLLVFILYFRWFSSLRNKFPQKKIQHSPPIYITPLRISSK